MDGSQVAGGAFVSVAVWLHSNWHSRRATIKKMLDSRWKVFKLIPLSKMDLSLGTMHRQIDERVFLSRRLGRASE